jgi:hypothetical protein
MAKVVGKHRVAVRIIVMPRHLVGRSSPLVSVITNPGINKTRAVDIAGNGGIPFTATELGAPNDAIPAAATTKSAALPSPSELSAKLRIRSDDHRQSNSNNGSSDQLPVHVVGEFTPRIRGRRIGMLLNDVPMRFRG